MLIGVVIFPTVGDGCDDKNYFVRAFVKFSQQTKGGGDAISITNSTDPIFFMLFKYVEIIHYGCAAVFFAILAYFCLVIFTRIIPNEHYKKDGKLMRAKKIRNIIYIASGLVIIASMTAMLMFFVMGLQGFEMKWWNGNNLTFWFEAICLSAFGVSWVVRGRLFGLILLDSRDR